MSTLFELQQRFQDAILLDWRNILDNVLLQVDIRQLDRKQYEPVARKLLESTGLSGFENRSFNHAIISQALQAMHATERILGEMLRVAEEAVVSFPNFAYRANREAIAQGHMPVSENLPFEWYETPNVRFFTIADFDALCDKLGIEIRERLAFDDAGQPVTDDPNLNGSLAFYRLGRKA